MSKFKFLTFLTVSNCTGPIISPPRADLVLVSPNDRRRTIYTRKWWALKSFQNVLKTTLTSYILFQRVKCKDPRKFLDGNAETKCGRDKKWSRTTFAECRCEWIFQLWKSHLCLKFPVLMLPKCPGLWMKQFRNSFQTPWYPLLKRMFLVGDSFCKYENSPKNWDLIDFCSGARCITPPPVPPPEANLESPVFEELGKLVDFRHFIV